jgi:hypothetical protein
MSDLQLPFDDKPIFDKDYCDENNIKADWFKFDSTTTAYLFGLVEESIDKNGEWVLEDVSYLGYTIYAILCYFQNKPIPQRLSDMLKSKSMKLSKLAVNHCIEEIEDSRIRIAVMRYKGKKGGEARAKKYPKQ